MSHGLLEVLRYFFLVLIWLFFIYAIRMVLVEIRRSRLETSFEEMQAVHEGRVILKLRVLTPIERRGQIFDLGGEVTLGRSSACVVSLDGDTFASSVHARVFPRNGELWLEDLGSTNGTFLNERRIAAPVQVKRGDRVMVGRTILEIGR